MWFSGSVVFGRMMSLLMFFSLSLQWVHWSFDPRIWRVCVLWLLFSCAKHLLGSDFPGYSTVISVTPLYIMFQRTFLLKVQLVFRYTWQALRLLCVNSRGWTCSKGKKKGHSKMPCSSWWRLKIDQADECYWWTAHFLWPVKISQWIPHCWQSSAPWLSQLAAGFTEVNWCFRLSVSVMWNKFHVSELPWDSVFSIWVAKSFTALLLKFPGLFLFAQMSSFDP